MSLEEKDQDMQPHVVKDSTNIDISANPVKRMRVTS
jgi:hypothetical protein